jgi:serine/threonine protein kinase/Tol biopolymer transport system component
VTPEEWQRVRPILESALELDPFKRSSFLDAACPDTALRSEVESLIAADEQGRSRFLQSLPVMRLVKGTRLGEYEIQSMLGAGGMGEVYRARDLRLRRDVAIKVLPAFVSSDPDRLGRFEQEATAAAALNHPNILAVHQMGACEGSPYLVSELLEGETLREHMRRGRLPVRKAVDYGVQIGRGLAAAHEKGVVHRDLKPENLFVTKDECLKILDFGLAKLMQADGASPSRGTEPGLVMGTVGYMSPEQVRGTTADHRADIFAFGSILYEMLSGKRAFQKPTAPETMTAILNDEVPPISEVAPQISSALQRVVHRCLEKNPERRFQSASDLAFALEGLSDPALSPVRVLGAKEKSRRAWWIGVGSIALIAAALIGWWTHSSSVPQVQGVMQLTDDGEPKGTSSALVSDGLRVYFNEMHLGTWMIAQVSTSGGQTAPVPSRLGSPSIAALAPGKSELLALVGNDFQAPLWMLPLPAGEPRTFGNLEAQDATFLPDGRIALTKGSELYIAEKDGSTLHKVAELPGYADTPAVSSNGKRIRFTIRGDNFLGSLWEVSSDGTGLHQILSAWQQSVSQCCGQWTSDGAYFVFQAQNQGRWDLWALPEGNKFLPGHSEPLRLTNGPLSYELPVPSRDGKQIFVVGSKRRGELVRYDAKSRHLVPYLSGFSAIDLTVSRDEKWVSYLLYPEHTLWRSRSDGSDRLQLTYSPMVVLLPRISPDGSKVAFSALSRGQDVSVYVQSFEGGPPQRITFGRAPTWSPDGNSIVFEALLPGKHFREKEAFEIHAVDLRTGAVSTIPDSRSKGGMWWPLQDKLIAVVEDESKFVVFDFKTRKWSDLAAGEFVNWMPSWDGKYLYCVTRGPEDPKALRIRLADGRVELIVSLKGVRRVVDEASGTWVGLSPDGSVLLTRDVGTQEIYALTMK